LIASNASSEPPIGYELRLSLLDRVEGERQGEVVVYGKEAFNVALGGIEVTLTTIMLKALTVSR